MPAVNSQHDGACALNQVAFAYNLVLITCTAVSALVMVYASYYQGALFSESEYSWFEMAPNLSTALLHHYNTA